MKKTIFIILAAFLATNALATPETRNQTVILNTSKVNDVEITYRVTGNKDGKSVVISESTAVVPAKRSPETKNYIVYKGAGAEDGIEIVSAIEKNNQGKIIASGIFNNPDKVETYGVKCRGLISVAGAYGPYLSVIRLDSQAPFILCQDNDQYSPKSELIR